MAKDTTDTNGLHLACTGSVRRVDLSAQQQHEFDAEMYEQSKYLNSDGTYSLGVDIGYVDPTASQTEYKPYYQHSNTLSYTKNMSNAQLMLKIGQYFAVSALILIAGWLFVLLVTM